MTTIELFRECPDCGRAGLYDDKETGLEVCAYPPCGYGHYDVTNCYDEGGIPIEFCTCEGN